MRSNGSSKAPSLISLLGMTNFSFNIKLCLGLGEVEIYSYSFPEQRTCC